LTLAIFKQGEGALSKTGYRAALPIENYRSYCNERNIRLKLGFCGSDDANPKYDRNSEPQHYSTEPSQFIFAHRWSPRYLTFHIGWTDPEL
jgi:hypothetical protein